MVKRNLEIHSTDCVVDKVYCSNIQLNHDCFAQAISFYLGSGEQR